MTCVSKYAIMFEDERNFDETYIIHNLNHTIKHCMQL